MIQPTIIIGGGVSGLAAAWMLHRAGQEFILLESDDRLGGHACTVDARAHGGTWAVDVGFIVCNTRTYPNFLRWMGQLGVALKPSTMTLAISEDATGIEWEGSGFSGVFAQRRNLLRPSHWSMLLGILRFHKLAQAMREAPADEPFASWCARMRIPRATVERYLLPMTAAIWSSPTSEMGAFPAALMGAFLDNHGMLQVENRPQWLTVDGGSRTYVQAMARLLGSRARTGARVAEVHRVDGGVRVRLSGGEEIQGTRCILAAHADHSLAMLADADDQERALLSAFPYRANRVGLHTDGSVLPRTRGTRAAWSVRIPQSAAPVGSRRADARVGPADEDVRAPRGPTGAAPSRDAPDLRMTYDMRLLQSIPAPGPLLVGLNGAVPDGPLLHDTTFHHPVFSVAAQRAQATLPAMQGRRNLHYAGAWHRFGFHEDGVTSAIAALAPLGIAFP